MRKKEFVSKLNTKLSKTMGELFYDTFSTAINNRYASDDKKYKTFTEVADGYMEVWASIVNHAANNYYDMFGEESVDEAVMKSDLNSTMFTFLASVAEIFLDFGDLIKSQHEVIALLDSQLSEIAGIENLGNEFNAKMNQLEFEHFEENGTEIS